jgi:uncharacterized paraquat-inducible protein A
MAIWLEYEGRRLPLERWAQITGLHPMTIRLRVTSLGWSVADALETPPMLTGRRARGTVRPCVACWELAEDRAIGRCPRCYRRLRARLDRGLASWDPLPEPQARGPKPYRATTPCRECSKVGVHARGLCGRCYRRANRPQGRAA